MTSVPPLTTSSDATSAKEVPSNGCLKGNARGFGGMSTRGLGGVSAQPVALLPMALPTFVCALFGLPSHTHTLATHSMWQLLSCTPPLRMSCTHAPQQVRAIPTYSPLSTAFKKVSADTLVLPNVPHPTTYFLGAMSCSASLKVEAFTHPSYSTTVIRWGS
uniref:Uncharacterized protein n=1 Tax=Cucumis sativus TaxID=3659 RepID=A0A0A0K8H1_CUCSA